MDTKLPNSSFHQSPASSPKARVPGSRKTAYSREFPAIYPLQRWQGHYKGPPPAFLRDPGPFLAPPDASSLPPLHAKPPGLLGEPLGIREVAELIGCSPWTVRQTLIARGLPFFRSAASGRLIFYTDQVIRWIESQQKGGQTTT